MTQIRTIIRNMNRRDILLFFIIFAEGYIVLATELLAMRQIIPFVGNGTDTIAIIMAGVLIPLALGYQAGGRFKTEPGSTTRRRLLHSMLISLVFLTAGLSYPVIRYTFNGLDAMGVEGRLLQTALYASIFLSIPVYCLGQTVPLISRYYSKKTPARVTGTTLFFSTFGAAAGAIISTAVLMDRIGVNYTVLLVLTMLFGLITLLSRRFFSWPVYGALAVFLLAGALNSQAALRFLHVVQMDAYHTVSVTVRGPQRDLYLNNNLSSRYTDQGRKYAYIEFVERQTVSAIPAGTPPKDILVIGAGGFTFGHEDRHNHYDFVDVNKHLKTIAERHILKEKLPENKHFHVSPARAFLHKTNKQYDVIFIDAYYGYLSVPDQLITAGFFSQVKGRLKKDGVVALNFITSPGFTTPFSRHLDNTIRHVFPYVSRHAVQGSYGLWPDKKSQKGNVVYLYRNLQVSAPGPLYTDNKNRAFIDKP